MKTELLNATNLRLPLGRRVATIYGHTVGYRPDAIAEMAAAAADRGRIVMVNGLEAPRRLAETDPDSWMSEVWGPNARIAEAVAKLNIDWGFYTGLHPRTVNIGPYTREVLETLAERVPAILTQAPPRFVSSAYIFPPPYHLSADITAAYARRQYTTAAMFVGLDRIADVALALMPLLHHNGRVWPGPRPEVASEQVRGVMRAAHTVLLWSHRGVSTRSTLMAWVNMLRHRNEGYGEAT